ncbi:MAG: hypothetical protein K2X28_05145 [Alphaproteobacteria bacterium]|nr:hypothetical protein [Alphaproteobacteria bacterium]
MTEIFLKVDRLEIAKTNFFIRGDEQEPEFESDLTPSEPYNPSPFSSSSSSSSSVYSAPTTFRTTGANEMVEIKHSAIYASFLYQNKPDREYSLIINHRTKDKGPDVRVFNPNTKTYIDLGSLSPIRGF